MYAAYGGKEVFPAKYAGLSNHFRKCKWGLTNFSKISYLFASSLAVDKSYPIWKGHGTGFPENQGRLQSTLLSCVHCTTPGRAPTANYNHSKSSDTTFLSFALHCHSVALWNKEINWSLQKQASLSSPTPMKTYPNSSTEKASRMSMPCMCSAWPCRNLQIIAHMLIRELLDFSWTANSILGP